MANMGMVLICDDLSRQNLGPPAKGLTLVSYIKKKPPNLKGLRV